MGKAAKAQQPRQARPCSLGLPALAGAGLLAALSALDVQGLSLDNSIDAVAGWDALINWAHGQRTGHLAELDRRQYPELDAELPDPTDPETNASAADNADGVDADGVDADGVPLPAELIAQVAAERAAARVAERARLTAQRQAQRVADHQGRDWVAEALSAGTRTSVYEAKKRLRTATALAGRLPQTAAALGTGQLSWGHAVVLSRATTALTPMYAMAVEAAVWSDPRVITPRHAERAADAAVLTLCPPTPDPDNPDPTPELHTSRDKDGPTVHAHLDAAGAHILATAIDSAATRTDPTDDRTTAHRRADALIEIADHWNHCRTTHQTGPGTGGCACGTPGSTGTGTGTAAGDSAAADPAAGDDPAGDPGDPTGSGCACGPDPLGGPGRRAAAGRRAEVLLTLSLETYLRLSDAPGYLPDGHPINAETARRLSCDTDLTRLILNPLNGGVIDLGRTARHPSTRQRRRIEERDNGCRFPSCPRARWRCQIHHTPPWNHGGPLPVRLE